MRSLLSLSQWWLFPGGSSNPRCALRNGVYCLQLTCLCYLERFWLKQFSCISPHSMLNWAESFISLMHNVWTRLWWEDLFPPDAIHCFFSLFLFSWQSVWAHPSSPLSGYTRHGCTEMTCKIVCARHKTTPCVNPPRCVSVEEENLWMMRIKRPAAGAHASLLPY